MKKIKVMLITFILCMISNFAFAGFELNKMQWIPMGSTSSSDIYYHHASMTIDENNITTWLCYHRKASDSYRLIFKQYTKGKTTATQLKVLNYYSDGTYKSGNAKPIENMPISKFENILLSRLWK